MDDYSSATAFDEKEANKILLMLEAVMGKRPSSKDIFNPVGLADKKSNERHKGYTLCQIDSVAICMKKPGDKTTYCMSFNLL